MGCQVYISYKRGEGAEHDLAAGLCGALQGVGAEVCCSDKDFADATAMPELLHALGEAKILVVVGTKHDNMEAKSSAEEWTKYLRDLTDGFLPDGEIVLYLSGMEKKDAPFGLRDRTAYDVSQQGDLVQHVKDKLGIKDPPQETGDSALAIFAFFAACFIMLCAMYDKPLSLRDLLSKLLSFEVTVPSRWEYGEGEPADRVYSMEEIASVDEVWVGERVTFGTYPQSNVLSDEAEPIQWRILAVEENRVLLLSQSLLDYRPYHQEDKNVTWRTCSLRRWLNRDFMNAAFGQDDQDKIAVVTHQNPKNETYGTKGGKATDDRIFLLTTEEAERYLTFYWNLRGDNTAYARAVLQSDAVSTGWWLRSPGADGSSAAYVDADGVIHMDGMVVDERGIAVRPALWVEISET